MSFNPNKEVTNKKAPNKMTTKYQEYARKNYTPFGIQDEMWHPEIAAECRAMDSEESQRREEAKRLAERLRISEVVESVADISAELAGRIVVRVSFAGSIAKTKKLTRYEKELVMKTPSDVGVPIGGDKPLFSSKEYDDLMSFIQTRRDEFARMGIPHIKFQAAHVMDITRIPEIDELAEKTESELSGLVDKLIAVYPDQITPEATRLGPLYNAQDYPSVESLKGKFTFDYDWMAFGVPEELKQFDSKIYAKAQAKAQKAWKEIEANGILLLRQTIADLATGLIESLTPKEDGTKRKFYASSVTKITDFVETFSKRNICNDAELDREIEKLRNVVSTVDLKAMSTDMTLRESVKKQVEGVKGTLDSLVTTAGSRVITFDEE